MQPLHSVTINIPGTSANLGPGFDCFGVALDISNEVTLQKEKTFFSHPKIIEEAALSFFGKTGLPFFPFSISVAGHLPPSRGLGSSVTIRLGVLQGLNEITGKPLSSLELYHLCSALEGHADNAAAAIFGGFSMALSHRAPLRYNISPELRFILVIPNFEVATSAARQLLPTSIPASDAAANVANAAVIAAAFATRDYKILRGAFHDKLHQPYRLPLVPFLTNVITTAETAGALGGWLSGSGSTIALLVEGNSIAEEVVAAVKKVSPEQSQIIVTSANNLGAQTIHRVEH